MQLQTRRLQLIFLILCLCSLFINARPFLIVISQDDLKDGAAADDSSDSANSDSAEWDEFGEPESQKSGEELDPGSWRPIFEPDSPASGTDAPEDLYYTALGKMMSAVSSGDLRLMEDAVADIDQVAAESGDPHAQSVLGLLYGMGIMKETNKAKAFLFHYFASEGNKQSKMALAYIYFRQEVSGY